MEYSAASRERSMISTCISFCFNEKAKEKEVLWIGPARYCAILQKRFRWARNFQVPPRS